MNANIVHTVSRIATTVAAFAAVGIVSGVVAPQAVHAQGLVEVYKGSAKQQTSYLLSKVERDAGGNYLFTNRVSDPDGNYLFTGLVCDPNGNYLFTGLVAAPIAPSDYGLVVPLSGSVTRYTTGGYSVRIESKSDFATVAGGNYLFAFGTDGNYLFTNSAHGLVTTPGGWGMDINGNIIAPDGSYVRPNAPATPRNGEVPAVSAFVTPAGYVLIVYKDGSRSVTLPGGSEYILHDTIGFGMNPSALFYD